MNVEIQDENITNFINIILNVSSIFAGFTLISYESSDNSFHDYDISFKFMGLFFFIMTLILCLLFHSMKIVDISISPNRKLFFFVSTLLFSLLAITCIFISICINLSYLRSDKEIEKNTPLIIVFIIIVSIFITIVSFCKNRT